MVARFGATENRLGVTLLAMAMLLPSVLILGAEPAAADSTAMMSATLPTGRYWTSAVWDGSNAYIFGGYGGSALNQIVRYNPSTDTVTTMSATLPTGRYQTSAVWDGSNAYVFGGRGADCCAYLNQIVRYNLSTDTVTTMSATLPTGRVWTNAVWDGSNAYIFGGSDGTNLNQIVRYNPSTDTVTTMSATLPTGRVWTSAVWDGSNAYVFGGFDPSILNQIVRYNPSTDTVTTMSATLPTGRYQTSAVWDGSNAYVFGGSDGSPPLNQIVRYNPSTDTVTTMSATLPTGRYSTSAVWDGSNAYIFGGLDSDYVNQIVRYDPRPPPGAPQALTAQPGPAAGQTTFTWAAPASDGGTAITNYRIYRGATSGGETFLAQIGNLLTYTDATCSTRHTCYYQVSAVNVMGEGDRSGEAFSPTRLLLREEDFTVAPSTPLPPVGVPVANVTVYDSGPNVCVDVTPSGGAPLNLACVNRSLLGPADPLVPRGTIPLLAPGALGTSPRLSVTLDVRYTYDPAQLFEVGSVLGGALAPHAPFAPTPDGVNWWLAHGDDVPLTVALVLYGDGVPLGSLAESIPWMGQALAAAQATAPEAPASDGAAAIFGNLAGVRWDGAQEWFVRVEPLTGTVTDIAVLPGVEWVFTGTHALDQTDRRYFLAAGGSSIGNRLFTVDLDTGAVLAQPAFSLGNFEPEYDVVTGHLFGVRWDGAQEWFVRVDPVTGTVTDIAVLPGVEWVFLGTHALDPLTRRYFLPAGGPAIGTRLLTVNLDTGVIIGSPSPSLGNSEPEFYR